MNKAVSRTLLFRSWGIGSGLVIVILVPLFLEPSVQGLYFSFASVIAIQIFFELGLGQVLLYRFASLHQSEIDSSSLDDSTRVYDLLYTSRQIYRYLAGLFFIIALFSGWYFFGTIALKGIDWKLPWLVLVAATSINLLQSTKLVYLEAVGQMHHVSVAKLRSSILGTILFCLIIACGGGLWAACALPVANAGYITYWLYTHRNAEDYLTARSLGKQNIRSCLGIWKQDIFPMQWRISLCWVSGFFMFQLYTPITLSRFGPVESGRIGVIVSVMSYIIVLTTTFSSAISPRLAALYSSGQILEYNKTFDRSAFLSIIALVVACLSVPLILYLINIIGLPFSGRFMSFGDAFIYSLVSISCGLLYLLSIYLRSQQEEPFVILSIFAALLTPPVLFIASSESLSSMLFAALGINLGSLAWGSIIYTAKRRALS